MLACGERPAPEVEPALLAPPPTFADPPPEAVAPEPAAAPPDVPDAAEAIRTVVRMSTPRVQACVEQGLKVDPAMSGRVSVGWSIVGGQVTEAHLVRNTTGYPMVGTCVVSAVRSFRFDPAVTAEVAEYPFQVSAQ